MSLEILLLGAGSLIVAESVCGFAVRYTRNRFPWLITKDDELPPFDWEKIKKIRFFEDKHDPELGWVPHPVQSGREKTFIRNENGWESYTTLWSTDSKGRRSNPGFEHLPDSQIACFGDSFTFARQVNDDETWPHQLSLMTGKNCANYGMGNFGLDQSLMRLERELKGGYRPEKVIVGVVPDTISRIVSVWKHYYEYGNTLNFKPRYVIKDGVLEVQPNLIRTPEDFRAVESGSELVKALQQNDFFYERKFKKDMLKFPYMFSILKNPSRNLQIIFHTLCEQFKERDLDESQKTDMFYGKAMQVIRRINLDWTMRLYSLKEPVSLLHGLFGKYRSLSSEYGFEPFFLFIPQKNELMYELSKGPVYSGSQKAAEELGIRTIDMTLGLKRYLEEHGSVDGIYSEQSEYGAHLNSKGNLIVAQTIYGSLNERTL